MSKIKNINLSNFKFFRGRESINIDGKHLLLYGENGCGKSSIFWGLYTLLEASLKLPPETDEYFKSHNKSEESLVNIYAKEMSCVVSKKEHLDSFIEIEDGNGIKTHISLLDSNICGDDATKESRKATDFINYQSIFKFQEFRNSQEPNLYEVFNYSILPYVNFASFNIRSQLLSNASDMWKAYQNGPGTTTNYKGDVIQVYKNSPENSNYLSFEKHFNNEFQNLLDFINQNASDILKSLGYNIEFKLKYKAPSHHKKDKNFEWTPYEVKFIITMYNGVSVKINRPHSFLNEAKMAAVATAIRLAILKYRVSSVAPQALKVLVLDDIMISLDMSNRDSLIELIIKDFSFDYQVIFLTHDKSLYNFVYYKITKYSSLENWKMKEMYVGECETTKEEYPVIIDGECDYLEKAKKFFIAKDYTTSAIYLRQTIEKIFLNAIPDEIKRSINEKMKDKFISLNDTWQQVKRVHNIPPNIQRLFEQSKLMILNPSAHHQRLSQPIYNRELKDAFLLVDELQKLNLLPDKLLIEKGKRLIFKHPVENYSFEFELNNDMIRSCLTGDSDPKCTIHTWQYNNIEFHNFLTGGVDNSYASCSPKFSRLKQGLLTLPLNIDEDYFFNNTMVESCKLKDII